MPVLISFLPLCQLFCAQGVCKYACSEEVPEPVDVGGEGYCVAFDPLDGSSIVDTNFAVGTIFGVWPGDKLKDITGAQQVKPPLMQASQLAS
jgi:fructose-1,6-bisphosphatase